MERIKIKVPLVKRLYNTYFKLAKVPFRRKWFRGYDLEGNSYWEFQLSSTLPKRRMVKQIQKTGLAFDVPPMWSQWLRFMKSDPPQLEDLIREEERVRRLKELVRFREMEEQSAKPIKITEDNEGSELGDHQSYRSERRVPSC